MTSIPPRVPIGSLLFDPVSEAQTVEHVRTEWRAGRGGRISTANVDILRRCQRDAAVRDLLGDADLVVADGAPVVWAARLRGRPVPERVAGSALIWSLASSAAREGRSVYLLGAAPGVAERAADVLREHAPGLRVAGCDSPPPGFDRDEAAFAAVRTALTAARPDLVFVALGSPRQEQVIRRLQADLPGAWWVGCGAAVDFVAGQLRRAPRWMQVSGLEWVHRLAAEPRRLVRRYLVDDAPYALRLLAVAATTRLLAG